jgi:multicomponent Na+:H+ antiporter subunit G
MISLLVHGLALVGAAFTLLAAIGLVRLPHTLWRMHAAAKAGTLGAGLLLIAVALATPPSAASRAVAAAAFLVITAPVAAHVLARRVGMPRGLRRRQGTGASEEPT